MIGAIQLFDMVWILTGGGPANSTTTMATFLITEGTKRYNYGIATAASVILFAVALVLAVLYQVFVLRRDVAQADAGVQEGPMSAARRRTARPRRRRRRRPRADAWSGPYRGGSPLVWFVALRRRRGHPRARCCTPSSAASAPTPSWPSRRPACPTPGCWTTTSGC